MSRDDILKMPLLELLKDVPKKAADFVIEGPEHARGVLNRVYRLEAYLTQAIKFIPKFDDDGRLSPLHEAIKVELQGE